MSAANIGIRVVGFTDAEKLGADVSRLAPAFIEQLRAAGYEIAACAVIFDKPAADAAPPPATSKPTP